jgi:ribosomal protein L11 methyltransferase
VKKEVQFLRWNKFTLKTTTEAEDIISSVLMELGIEGIEIEDKVPLTEGDKQHMFGDVAPELEPDDGVAYISFYLDLDIDKDEILGQIREELKGLESFLNIGEASIEESTTEDLDWVNNWKQYFKQFYVDDILIIPSWEDVKPQDEGKLIIHIDPGTAFGTGMHETTQLCMKQLKKYVTSGMKILDVGCGSGILSITALKLGALKAVGTDLDPSAITATRENKEANHVKDEQLDVIIGNLIDDTAVKDAVGYQAYDIVAANILADVLIPLTPVALEHLKTGGFYIISGIIDTKETQVLEAVKNSGLEVLETTYQGEWVSITARKN